MADAIATEYVEVRPDTKGFGRELQRGVGKESQKAGKHGGKMFSKGMLLAAGGVAVGVGAAGLAVKGFVQQAMAAEVQTTRAKTAFKAMGVGTDEMNKAMGKASKTATQLGFDDEVATESLATLSRTTGNVATGQRALAAAMDVARARGISLEAATKVVSRAQFGNARVLQQMGIQMEKSTGNVDRMKARIKDLKEQQKGATAEEKKAIDATIKRIQSHAAEAKQLDKQATARKALGLIEKNLGKQAEEFSKTSAGALANLGERWQNFQEDVGAAVLPIVADLGTKAANALGTFATVSVDAIGKAKQALGPYVDEVRKRFGPELSAAADQAKVALGQAFEGAGPAISQALASLEPIVRDALSGMAPGVGEMFTAVKTAISQNLESARSIVQSFATAISNIWGRWGNEIKATVKVVWNQVVIVIRTSLLVVSNLFAAFAAVLRGDWGEAWNKLKQAAKVALDGVVATAKNLGPALAGALRAGLAQLRQSGSDLAGKIKEGVTAGLKALPGVLAAGIAALPGIVSAFLSTMVANGRALAGKIKDGLVAGLKALPGALAGGITAAFQVFSSIASAAFNIAMAVGGSIIDGMVSGVRSAAGRLAQAAIDAAKGAIDAAKNIVGFGSPARAFIPIGESMMQGIGVGIKQWAPALNDELKNTMRDVIRNARQNVSSLAGDVAGIIGDVLDKRKDKPQPQTAAQKAVADAQTALDAQAHQQRIDELTAASTDLTKTEAERNEALLQLTIEKNKAQADADDKSQAEAIEKQKAALNQQIADLTDAFNRKKKEEDGSIITSQEYMERLQKLLRDAVPDFGSIGSELGSAVANQFQDSLAAIAAQLEALKGEAGIGAGDVIDPTQVRQAMDKLKPARRKRAKEADDVARAQKALDDAKARSTNAKGPGGSNVTDAERAAIERAQKEFNLQQRQLTAQEAIVATLERIANGGGTVQLTTTLAR